MLKDFENKKISSKKIINTIEDNWKLDKFYTKYKTQIAKAEPSQKQESEVYWNAFIKHPKSNEEFIALRQPTRDKARNLAMDRCFDWVTNNLKRENNNMQIQYQACSQYLKISKEQTQISKLEKKNTN